MIRWVIPVVGQQRREAARGFSGGPPGKALPSPRMSPHASEACPSGLLKKAHLLRWRARVLAAAYP